MKEFFTRKMRRFAESYARTGDAQEAVLDAGYTIRALDRKANALLKRTCVQNAIADAQAASKSNAPDPDLTTDTLDAYEETINGDII